MIGLVSCGFRGHHFILLLPEGLVLQCFSLLSKYSIEDSGTVPKSMKLYFILKKKFILKLN